MVMIPHSSYVARSVPISLLEFSTGTLTFYTLSPSLPSVFFKDPAAVDSTFISLTMFSAFSDGYFNSFSGVAMCNSTGGSILSRATVPIHTFPESASVVVVLFILSF